MNNKYKNIKIGRKHETLVIKYLTNNRYYCIPENRDTISDMKNEWDSAENELKVTYIIEYMIKL
jgi:hypothetical protein